MLGKLLQHLIFIKYFETYNLFFVIAILIFLYGLISSLLSKNDNEQDDVKMDIKINFLTTIGMLLCAVGTIIRPDEKLWEKIIITFIITIIIILSSRNVIIKIYQLRNLRAR
jgi:hypothetical protein